MSRGAQVVPIGTILGVRVFASFSFVIVIAIAGFWAIRANSTPELITRLGLISALLGSVLVHELAHAKTAAALGIPVRHVVLTWFGGFAEFWVKPQQHWREALIAAAGPAANFVIAGLTFLAILSFQTPPQARLISLGLAPDFSGDGSLLAVLRTLLWVNLAMACFNLLPGLPLDGGHILKALLSTRMPLGRAEWIAAWCGVVVGIVSVALAVAAQRPSLFLAGLFVIAVALNEKQRMRYD